ncbi:hypothetical protein HXX76_005918 [Chlamydomonas incerta]|uniref:Uncharacterized protein n=1 Tax=Chlamydomonas incerta TaxID=51695 RepID=A0A835TGB5_CHLIN|nr:hypothetical protein HXX76_005918 [Chlamydomonas incerta]|eukprot:KAG2437255.1 hypothetical protein HXX76_005918 [Chlamydomonas incerta]
MASTRPLSGVSAGDQSARSHISVTSAFYQDNSAVLSLANVKGGSERPVSALINHLVDANYDTHDNRKVVHANTTTYSMFSYRVSESQAAAAATPPLGSISGSGMGGAGVFTRRSTDASFAGGSSLRFSGTGSGSGAGGYWLGGTGTGTGGHTDSGSLVSGSGSAAFYGGQPTAAAYFGGSLPPQPDWGGVASGRSLAASSRATSALSGGARSAAGGAASVCFSTAGGAGCMPVGGAELEVVALYDGNFQAANARGQHGVPLRVPAPAHIGPLSYVYRWYCKRATQFVGAVGPADLPDAPALPPSEKDAASRRGSSSGAAPSTSPAPAARVSGSGSAAAPGGAPALPGSASPRRAASTGAGGLPSPYSVAKQTLAGGGSPSASPPPLRPAGPTPAASGAATAATASNGPPRTTSGRRLNRALDPVMNLSELMDLLEDLQIVPHAASRADVTRLFNLSRQAAPHGSTAAVAGAGVGSAAAGGRPPTAPPAPGLPHAPPRPGTAGVTGNSGGRAGSPGVGVVVKAQPHPDEIRYPAFLDFLVRLAVAIGCCDTKPSPAPAPAAPPAPKPAATSSSGRTSLNGGAGDPSLTRNPEPKPSLEALSRGWSRSVGAEEAAAAVRRLLGRMRLSRTDLLGLKQRLDALARMAGEAGARAKSNKLLYVTGPSALEAAAGVQVAAAPPATGPLRPPPAPGAPPLPAAAAAGTTYGAPPAWAVTSPQPAPGYLLALLASEDRGDGGEYRPAWREFGAAAIDLGLLAPGELRLCRLVLLNRGVHQLAVKVESAGAPFCRCSYTGLQAMPPGMPKHVEVSVQLAEPGEVLGELRLVYTSARDRHREEHEVVVPVYGMVGLPGGAEGKGKGGSAGRQRGGGGGGGGGGGSSVAAAGSGGAGTARRMVPTTAAERGVIASKTAREGLLPASVAAAAVLAGPLPHNAPRRASSVGAGSLVGWPEGPLVGGSVGLAGSSRGSSRLSGANVGVGGYWATVGGGGSWFRGSRTGSGNGDSWYGDLTPAGAAAAAAAEAPGGVEPAAAAAAGGEEWTGAGGGVGVVPPLALPGAAPAPARTAEAERAELLGPGPAPGHVTDTYHARGSTDGLMPEGQQQQQGEVGGPPMLARRVSFHDGYER